MTDHDQDPVRHPGQPTAEGIADARAALKRLLAGVESGEVNLPPGITTAHLADGLMSIEMGGQIMWIVDED